MHDFSRKTSLYKLLEAEILSRSFQNSIASFNLLSIEESSLYIIYVLSDVQADVNHSETHPADRNK